VKQRERIYPQGVFRRYGQFGVSGHGQHLSQTMGIYLEIFPSQSQLDHNLPDAGRTEKKSIFGGRQKDAGRIGEFFRLSGGLQENVRIEQ